MFAGYHLLLTSEIQVPNQQMYTTYHNLWRIEESFKIMKSDLDALPAFLQKEETIKGHFLICYITVLLERLLQFNILGGQYSSGQIIEFIRKFKVVQAERGYINVTTTGALLQDLEAHLCLPLTNYHLTASQIKNVLAYKF